MAFSSAPFMRGDLIYVNNTYLFSFDGAALVDRSLQGAETLGREGLYLSPGERFGVELEPRFETLRR
jgi:hypothetical protein